MLVGQAESNNWLIMEDDPAAGAADSLKFSPFNGSSYFLWLFVLAVKDLWCHVSCTQRAASTPSEAPAAFGLSHSECEWNLTPWSGNVHLRIWERAPSVRRRRGRRSCEINPDGQSPDSRTSDSELIFKKLLANVWICIKQWWVLALLHYTWSILWFVACMGAFWWVWGFR